MNAQEARAEARSLKSYATSADDRLWRTTKSGDERVADVAEALAAAREADEADKVAWATFDVKARHGQQADILPPF